MNDKDKEAFEKFMGENLPFSYYEYYSCPDIDAWQAACEHKQKEIEKQEKDIIQLAEENEHYHNSLLKLEKENDELKSQLERVEGLLSFCNDKLNFKGEKYLVVDEYFKNKEGEK